jgi:transposase
VAKLFGVSLSQLARWVGRTRQALTKTPDAASLQPALGYFERVAR